MFLSTNKGIVNEGFYQQKMTDMWKQILDTFQQNVITFVLNFFLLWINCSPPPPFCRLGSGQFCSTVLFSSVFLFESLYFFYNLMLHLECNNFVVPLPTSRELSLILQRWWFFLLHDNLDIVSPINGENQWSNSQCISLGIKISTVRIQVKAQNQHLLNNHQFKKVPQIFQAQLV